MRIGDNDVIYNSDFRLFMTCKMTNPHFLPELSIKVFIIYKDNFNQFYCNIIRIRGLITS